VIAGAYAEGVRQGAPEAAQLADRFHFFCNLTQAVQRVLTNVLQRVQVAEPSGSPSAPGEPVDPTGQVISPITEVPPETPFGSTWRGAGQRAVTMCPNSVAGCVSAAMVDSGAE
jgi:hypothetical protein